MMRATQVPPANVFFTVCLLAGAEEFPMVSCVGTLSSVEVRSASSDSLLEPEATEGNGISEPGSGEEESWKASLLRMLPIQRDEGPDIQ